MKTTMKTLAAIALVAMSLACGCKTTPQPKIEVIENTTIVTNTVPLRAFNDEQYIWQNWLFSTNKVNQSQK